MKTRTGKVSVVLAVWFAVAASGQAVIADEPIPCEKRLPKSVLAYVSLRNVADFKTQWSKTLFGQLERDDALADFRAEVERQFADAAKTLEDNLGMSFSDLLAIPHGEIAAAAMLGQGGRISAVAFLDFGDREEAMQKLLAKAAEALENDGAKRSEEEVEETKVVVFQRANEEGDQKPRDAGAWFLKDSFLVLGTDLAALKNVLTRWDGKQERVLAENDVFRYVVDRCRDENADHLPQLTWFVDPVAMVQSVAANPQQGLRQMALVVGMIPALGIDKFRGVGGTFDLADGDYDTVSRTLVYLDRPAKGVINLVQFDSGAQAPPKWLSADWSGFTSVNWNVAKAYAAAEGLIDMFQSPGATAQMLQALADDEHSGGIHLKKDVLDQLTGTFHIAEDDGGGKAGAEGGFLVAAELRNVAAFRATLTKLARIPGMKINEREFQGETLYEVAMGGGGEDDEDAGESKPTHFGFAIAEKHLMVASDVRLLERVMRGIGDRETLADSAAFKRISRKFPDQTASISFSRQDTQFKRIYEALRTGQAEQAGALVGGAFGAFDFSKLPDFDALKKYLPASGGFMERDERGLKLTSFSLRNESD
ncbi:MAG: hypothetical protein ACM3U2_18035 [Deltaproteobacteria bacterium]